MQYIGSTTDLRVLDLAYNRLQEANRSGIEHVCVDIQQPNGGFSVIVPKSQDTSSYGIDTHSLDSLAQRIDYINQHQPSRLYILAVGCLTKADNALKMARRITRGLLHREFEPLLALSKPLSQNADKNELLRALRTLKNRESMKKQSVYVSHLQGFLGEQTHLVHIAYLEIPQPPGSEIKEASGINDIEKRLEELAAVSR